MYKLTRILLAVTAIAVTGVSFVGDASAKEYPKLAPFAGVRWEEDKPVVKIGAEWFTLVSLDGISAETIVAYSQRSYEDKWRKRFGEDLVEVLAGMGHEPKDAVRLVVSPLETSSAKASSQRTLEGVAMTAANRTAIKARGVERVERRAMRTAAVGAASQKSSQKSSRNLTDEWVERAAAPWVKHRVVDGISIGYIEGKHWGIVHLGTSNRAKKKADNKTLYELGSLSKVFTSLLLADAAVRGEIDLNAAAEIANPAGIRLPSRDGRSIKWIDLSTHRSGLPRLPDNLPLTTLTNPYRDYDSRMAAAFLNEYELPRQPGQSQEYSNVGASVLGYLVAQKAGKSYEELLRERIAKPLRMTDCTVSLSTDQRKRLATPHEKFGSPTALWTFADLPGAGGIHGTMFDMMHFAKAHLAPPPVTPATGKLGEAIELAWKQHRDADASGPATGLGWMIWSDGQTRWHNGGTGGSRSAIFINRESKCAVIVLCNTAVDQHVEQLAMQLIAKAAGTEVKPERSEPVEDDWSDLAIDEKLRGRLVGRYELNPNFVFDVRNRDGRLMVGITNQPINEVFPDSPTRWSYRGIDATLEFKLTKTGPAKSLVLHQNGAAQTARRIQDLAIDEKLRGRLVGRYELNPKFIFDVRNRDGRLMVGITNQPINEVFPDSPTRWSYRGIDATLEFNLAKTGPAKSLVLHQHGAAQTARRIK